MGHDARDTVIRGAQLDDAAEIARLSGELGYPNDVATLRARLTGLLSGDLARRHRVAVAAGPPGSGLCGWVHVARAITLESGECAEILGLIVDSAYRRTGVGQRLVGAAESWGRAQGLERVTVRSNAVRQESHAFYAAIGYQRSKSQHVYSKPLASTIRE